MKNLLSLPEKHVRIFFFSSLVFFLVTACTDKQPVDRKALVTRHNVTITSPDSLSPVSVGNGGLLTAVALMCVEKQFPSDGTWNVRFENLNKYPE